MWQTQSRKFTTNYMVTVELCFPEFSAAKIVTRKFHVDDSTESRYNMILGRYLLTKLGLYLKFSEHVIIGGDGLYEG